MCLADTFRQHRFENRFFWTTRLMTWKPASVLKRLVSSEGRSVRKVLRGAHQTLSVRTPVFPDPRPYDLEAEIGFEQTCFFGRQVGQGCAWRTPFGPIDPNMFLPGHQPYDWGAGKGF